MSGVHRRDFLARAAIGTLSLGLAPTIVPSAEGTKLKAGLVGCGWYGMVDARAALLAGGVEFVALADVDKEHLSNGAAEIEKLQGRRPKTFADYRDLLREGDLQVLFIATPPHWHALIFLAALERGLDIYCEKPLAYDVREGRAMVDAARKSDRVVQVGFQRRQSLAINQARDYIRDGRAGRIVQVGVQIHYTAGMKDSKPQDPPPALDWDAWCGPAPKLPYSPNIGHFAWRLEAEYGNGHLVDWGIHLIDATRRVLGEKAPRAVQAAGGLYYFKGAITTPDILTAHFDFETCPVIWRHRIWGAAEESPRTQNGIFFYGETETVFVTDGWWMVIPRDSKAERKEIRPEGQEDMGGLHVKDFLEAVRTRKPTACDVEDGYHSTTTVQLGMIAYRTGSRVVWDAKREEITETPEAAKLLKREYRSPWQHPYPG